MRIKYEILWVEDNNTWYEETKGLFEDILEDAGFLMNCTPVKKYDDLQKLIDADGLQKFDLLLVDFMLGGDASKFGDSVIQTIRDKDIYTDIIFYSSNLDSVHQKIKENQIEGVYSSSRTHIESKFNDIFLKTIKKIQEVNTIRGLLMAETSDLDELMVDIIQIALIKEYGENLSEYIKRELEATIEKNKSLIDAKNQMSDKVNNSRIFTSFHKAKAINKIYKLHPELTDEKFYANYNKDVIRIRNLFGHVKEEDGKLISTLTGEVENFDEAKCTAIRKDLTKYRTKLNELKAKIGE